MTLSEGLSLSQHMEVGASDLLESSFVPFIYLVGGWGWGAEILGTELRSSGLDANALTH